MRVYIGFDDTDNLEAAHGTGKVARWFEDKLPEQCRLEGVVRQQLLIHENIPYTSHNSSACAIIQVPERLFIDSLIQRATEHIIQFSLEDSDPGICVACEPDVSIARLIAFGRRCTERVVTQKEAMDAAGGVHISGHGGTNDGIIGAAAAVGLTASGWYGRFIEYNRLRDFPEFVTVSDLERSNITVVSMDREARVPSRDDMVFTKGWLRPRLLGTNAVLMVVPKKEGLWESAGEKRHGRKEKTASPVQIR